MTANLFLSQGSIADVASGGSLAGTSAVSASLAITNLQGIQPSVKARWASLVPYVDASLGRNRSVGAVIWGNHNGSRTCTWRVRAADYADTGYAAPTFDSGAVRIWPRNVTFGSLPWYEWPMDGIRIVQGGNYGLCLFTQTVSAGRVRVDIDDSASALTYHEAGRLLVVNPFRPAINIQNGWSMEIVDESRKTKSRGGQTYVDELAKFRRMAFDLALMPELDAFGNALQIDIDAGVSGDLFACIDTDNAAQRHNMMLYATQQRTGAIVQQFHGRYRRPFVLDQML